MASIFSVFGKKKKHGRRVVPAPKGFHHIDELSLGGAELGFDRIMAFGPAKMHRIDRELDPLLGPVFEITVSPKSSLVFVVDDREVGPGVVATGSFVIWKPEGTAEVRSRVSRFGGTGENEQTVTTSSVAQDYVTVRVEHEFVHEHLGARIQIDTRTEETTFHLAKPALKLIKPETDAELESGEG